METISPQSLVERAGPDVHLIDVRTPIEFRALHARPARNVPLDALDPHSLMQAGTDSRDAQVYVICKSGARAAKACQKLVAAGYANVVVVEGGTDAWLAAGLPVVRGQRAISLERQVRIVAGLIVAVSGLLALLVHPYFAGIAACVGAGLVFAGITDSCAMGMLLAKMPWNQVQPDPTCGA